MPEKHDSSKTRGKFRGGYFKVNESALHAPSELAL